jgi:pSer/pThr/pTyr-binding forkhead associated (FHA) protein
MSEPVPTVRELVGMAHAGSDAELVARFGAFALVGPGATPGTDAPGFRYATEHGKRPGGVHPMASLLESVVYGLVKRAGSPFPNVLVVGRAPNSDVWIDDARVSKLHARVTVDPAGGLSIADGGSANGTFVDDRRLAEREERPLVEGTRVAFGDRTFVVRNVATLHATLKRFPKP